MHEESAQILVVDDNEMNRDMLSRRLERQGYQVMVAEDGQRALDMMRQKNYDLVLLDIMMPNVNGYEVLEQVREDEALRQTPIIMISAVDDLDSVVKCIELGAEDYLFKPFNPVLLRARVSASLEKRRLRESGGMGDGERKQLIALSEQIQHTLTNIRHGIENSGPFSYDDIAGKMEEVARLVDDVKRIISL